MDFYTASSWRPPTVSSSQHTPQSILRTKKRQVKTAGNTPPKSITLQTINENTLLKTDTLSQRKSSASDPAALQSEITYLHKKCAILEAQRNEALDTLGQLSAEPHEKLSTCMKQIKQLQAQRDEAFAALDEVVSKKPPKKLTSKTEMDSTKAKIHQLECQNQTLESHKRTLEERCKTFAAWTEQLRTENKKLTADCEKQQKKCDDLNEALTEFSSKHSRLMARYKEIDAKLAESSAIETDINLQKQISSIRTEAATDIRSALDETAKAQARAVEAEKTIQALLGVKALLKTAPVGVELSNRTHSILQSAIEVLNLANQPTAPQTIQNCLTQVCSALADLGDEATVHANAAGSWLTKKESVLRSCKQPQQQ